MSLQIESKANEYGEVELNKFTPQQIAQLVHELSALAWISVEDELPKEEGWYQVKIGSGKARGCIYSFGGFIHPGVTHWQPLAKAGSDND